MEDKNFYNIIDYLNSNDVLVFNNTKVFKARIFGKKESGVVIEILLLEPIQKNKKNYLALTKGKVHKGTIINCGKDIKVKIVDILENGDRVVNFNIIEYESLKSALDAIADMPLPNYIESTKEKQLLYQTVYASNDEEKSVAAPTAGFHFTDEILNKIKSKGIIIEYISLNVGVGTFRPVKVENVDDHIMHFEEYHINEDVLNRLNTYKKDGKRIIAVGTTSIRTLEDSSNDTGVLIKTKSNTNLFIKPGYKFKFVDAVITNFHLPKSTLLMLVCAFAQKELIIKAYKYAVKKKYRFFSFGDAMFIK